MRVVRVKGDTQPVRAGFDAVRMVQGEALVFAIDEISDSSGVKVDVDTQAVSIVHHLAVV